MVRYGNQEYSPVEAVRCIENGQDLMEPFRSLAEEAGSSKAVNMVLMGRLSHYFPNIAPEAGRLSGGQCACQGVGH